MVQSPVSASTGTPDGLGMRPGGPALGLRAGSGSERTRAFFTQNTMVFLSSFLPKPSQGASAPPRPVP